MAQNPYIVPKNHPIYQLLNSAVNGRKLTNNDLALLDQMNDSLPAGESFTKVKSAVLAASKGIADKGNQGMYQDARQLRDDAIADIAPRLSDEARSLNTSIPAGNDVMNGQESLDDLAAKMYDS